MSLRIGIDAWGLSGPAHHTGMGQYTAQLLAGAAERGASVVAYGASGEPAPDFLPDGVTWRAVPAAGPRRSTALESRMVTLPRLVAEDGIDVFHAPGLHVRPSFPPVPRLGCPLVVTVHDAIPITYYGRSLPRRNRLYWRWNLSRAMRAERILTVSDHARQEICAVSGLRPKQITVIPNATAFAPNCDPLALRRLGVRPPFLLFAGSFEPRKNLHGALAAFDILAPNHPELSMVAVVDQGSGHAEAGRRHRERMIHAERVQFAAGLAQPDLEALYTAAQVVLFCSLAEGFGFPAVQAAACGTPIVASDLPVIHEVVGDLPVYVDPTSAASIADGIRRALDDDLVRGEAALGGPAAARRHHPAEWADAHLDVYRSTMKGDTRACI